jgi:hypothetical protein
MFSINPVSYAADSPSYDYQVQSVNFAEKTKFYFFRFNRDSGVIEVYSYDNAQGDAVSWHPVRQMKDAYTYIVTPK